jgi:predicted nucleotidyltransferase
MMVSLSLSAVQEAILSLGEQLKEVEAIGIMGSLARGDFNEYSDIDVFVIVKERRPCYDADRIWWDRIKEALSKFQRDVTVITYSVRGLKCISNWYVLRLASEGILIYDKGGIRELFEKIIKTAREAGLEEKKIGNHRVWSAKNLKLGQRLVLEVKD